MISKSKTLICLHWNEKIRFYFLPAENCSHILLLCMRLMTKSDMMCVNSDELGYKTMGKISILFSALLHQSQAHNDKTESMPSISALVTDSCKYLKFSERFWLSTLKPTLYLAMFKKKENDPKCHRF